MTLAAVLVLDQERRIKALPVYTQTFTKRDAINPRNVLRQVDPTVAVPWRLHGTRYAYARLRCRCEECRAANARHSRAMREKLPRSERVGMPETISPDQGRVGRVLTVAFVQPTLFAIEGRA